MIKKTADEIFNEENTDGVNTADYDNATKEAIENAVNTHNESIDAHAELFKKKSELVTVTIAPGQWIQNSLLNDEQLIDPNYENEYYDFSADINIAGLTAENSAIVFVPDYDTYKLMVKAECKENVLRVYAAKCPVNEVKCRVQIFDSDGIANVVYSGEPTALGHLPEDMSNILKITIPSGRMSGDADGDGRFTENDLDIILKCMRNSSEITDEMQRRCCDVNRDNIVNYLDTNCINELIAGGKAGSHCRDLSNNWQWNENYKTEDGQFYTDITIEGMTSSSSAIVAIDTVAYAGDYYAECLDGKLRIYAKLCPVNELAAVVTWGKGDGTAAVVFVGEASEIKFNMIKIPAARMLGDINGDGKIDEQDIAIISQHVASGGKYITDEMQLLCADVDGSGAVTANDGNAINAYMAGTRDLTEFSYDVSDAWHTIKPIGGSKLCNYADIKIEGMNTKMSAYIVIKGKSRKNNFFAECHNEFIRIFAKFPPISELDAIVIWGNGNRTAICSIEETEDVVNESNCKMCIFSDIEITEEMWTKSRGIPGYSYRASLPSDDIPGLDDSCYADVIFDTSSTEILANLAPVCRTNRNGSLDIFAKSPVTVMIATIAAYKVV